MKEQIETSIRKERAKALISLGNVKLQDFSKKQIGRMGIDSFIVIIVYLLGIWGLLKLI